MSHKPTKPIQQQIVELIKRRKDRPLLEIKSFEMTKRDAEYVYGLGGGNAGRCDKAIEVRQNELEQLEALEKGYGAPPKITVMNIRYVYRCECGEIVELRSQATRDYIDCPNCRHGIPKIRGFKIEREVIVPPIPRFMDDLTPNEWRSRYE